MSGPQEVLEDIGRNIALVLGLMLAFGWIRGFAHKRRMKRRSVLSGLLFGVASLASLAAPVRLAPGVFMDMRNVLVALAFVFEGPIAGIVAGAIAIGYRLWVAGSGLVPGVLLIIMAMVIGAGFCRRSREKRTPSPWVLLGLGACISAAALLLTLLLVRQMPFASVLAMIERVFLAVAIGYPLGALLVGSLLSYERVACGV